MAWQDVAPDVNTMLGRTEVKDAMLAGARLLHGPLPHLGSSAALELRALREAMLLLGEALRGRTLVWYCDAAAAVGATRRWRSPSPGVLTELRLIWRLCTSLGCSVRPNWVSRELGWQPAADYLSRLGYRRCHAEWMIPPSFAKMWMAARAWDQTTALDAFAAGRSSSQLATFATRFPTAGAITDGLSVAWSGRQVWAFPPFSQVRRSIRKAEYDRPAEILLVAPRRLTTELGDHWSLLTEMPADVRLVAPDGTAADVPPPSELVLMSGRW